MDADDVLCRKDLLPDGVADHGAARQLARPRPHDRHRDPRWTRRIGRGHERTTSRVLREGSGDRPDSVRTPRVGTGDARTLYLGHVVYQESQMAQVTLRTVAAGFVLFASLQPRAFAQAVIPSAGISAESAG